MSVNALRRGTVFAAIAIVAVLLIGAEAYAQEIQTVIEQAKARYEQFEKNIEDMTINQSMSISTQEGVLTAETKMMKKGKRFRMENRIDLPENAGIPEEMRRMMGGRIEVINIFDGTDTWTIHPFAGKSKLSGEEKNKYRMLSNWWELIPSNAEIVGEETVDGRTCHIIKIQQTEETPFSTVWLDTKDLVLVKGENIAEGATYTIMNSEFKKIDEAMPAMPYRTEVSRDGKTEITLIVKSIEVNTGLSDDIFDPEKVELKGVGMDELMKKMKDGKK